MIQPLSFISTQVAGTDTTATFLFDYVPVSQQWTFTINCPTAPDTAVFTASSGGTNYGQFRGSNTWGAIQIGSGDRLQVSATGLVPGVQYTVSIIGTAYTSEDADPVYPTAYAESVSTATEQIVLVQKSATAIAGINTYTFRINLQPAYRSIYAVGNFPTDPGTGFNGWRINATGVQSQTKYQPFIPPYFQPAGSGSGQFPDTLNVRFPILNGVDTQLDVTILCSGVTVGTAFNMIVGADLAPVDTSIYYANANETNDTQTKYGTIPVGNIQFLDGIGNFETLPLYVVDYGGLLSVSATVSTTPIALLAGVASGQAIRLHSLTIINGTAGVSFRLSQSYFGLLNPITSMKSESTTFFNGLLLTSSEGAVQISASAVTTSATVSLRYDIVDLPSITYL